MGQKNTSFKMSFAKKTSLKVKSTMKIVFALMLSVALLFGGTNGSTLA